MSGSKNRSSRTEHRTSEVFPAHPSAPPTSDVRASLYPLTHQNQSRSSEVVINHSIDLASFSRSVKMCRYTQRSFPSPPATSPATAEQKSHSSTANGYRRVRQRTSSPTSDVRARLYPLPIKTNPGHQRSSLTTALILRDFPVPSKCNASTHRSFPSPPATSPATAEPWSHSSTENRYRCAHARTSIPVFGLILHCENRSFGRASAAGEGMGSGRHARFREF